MKIERHQIHHLLLRARSDAIALGLPAPHFPFLPSEVSTIHTHKDGIGDGVWFRLADGRVFNRFAEEQDRRPTLYDRGIVVGRERERAA